MLENQGHEILMHITSLDLSPETTEPFESYASNFCQEKKEKEKAVEF